MEVVIVPDATAGGELIAEAIASLLSRKPDALLGVATGSTPLPIYRALAAKVASGAVDASRARICQLDEYVGLPAGHPESYRSVVLREVVEPLGLSEASFMGPDGSAEDVQAACEAYDRALAEAGGVDLQLLGIGTDGHIGFNEPCSSLASRTRIKTLTEQTRVDNARFFDDDIDQVPHHVITQGIGTILDPGTRSCWPPGRARRRPSPRRWRGRSPRSCRPRRSSCTRTRRWWWTRPPRRS
ncbi:Glucosamine-6-phosphate deaminase [Streptomyces microflavus]